MAAKQSERIKLWGIVQGVGFRPYVAKTAAAFQMKGQVLNIGGLVEITVTDTAERVSAFLHALIENKPAPSEIVHIKREPIEYQHFDAFTIIKSAGGDDETAMIPADLSICPSCLEELYDKNNPRYQHPFISCMVCGPRYTIIDKIPYDRENTSMAEFPMCDFCNGEYTELSDRRYHAQTISCHDCGPVLLWKGADGGTNLGTAAQTGKGAGRTIQGFTKQTGNAASQINSNYLEQSESLKAQAKPTAQQTETSDSQVNLDCMAQAGNTATQTVTIPNGCSAPINTIIPHAAPNDAALTDTPVSESAVADAAILDTAANILQNGGVLLFKSAGGYNLVANPFNQQSVTALRTIKNREEKPFAVMFRNLAQIRRFCLVNAVEEKLLVSSARPILLLEHRFGADTAYAQNTSVNHLSQNPEHQPNENPECWPNQNAECQPDQQAKRRLNRFCHTGSSNYSGLDANDNNPASIAGANSNNPAYSPNAANNENASEKPINAGCTASLGLTELRKSRFIGSFLPSFAAQYLLLDRISPLIFTSANLSGLPMIKDDAEAFSLLEKNPQISGILYNKRKIRIRIDDSVVRVIDGQPQMIRRSKGYSPVPLYVNINAAASDNHSGENNTRPDKGGIRPNAGNTCPDANDVRPNANNACPDTNDVYPDASNAYLGTNAAYPNAMPADPGTDGIPSNINTDRSNKGNTNPDIKNASPDTNACKNAQSTQLLQIFAAGSQLKNSFALTKGNFVYMSQFFGDMDTLENQQVYEKNTQRLKSLFRITPQAVACDMHPLYFTTQFAERYAAENNLPLIKIQHHHAHIASVMAENNLQGKVIGISFDGTGYGTDGNIWGGEFFLCEGAEMQRIAHLQYVDMIGGDSSVKDAVRSALSYIHAHDKANLAASIAPAKSADENNPGFTVHAAAFHDGGNLYEIERSRQDMKNAQSECLMGDESSAKNKIPVNSKCSVHAAAFHGYRKPNGDGKSAKDESQQIAIDIPDIIAFGRKRLLGLPAAQLVMPALEAKINTVRSSSMGRLFDAVSALLQIKDYNSYEGQCAIMLEDAAAFAQKYPGKKENCDLALAFHHRIIDMIVSQCQTARRKYRTSQVALSGGTFQNKILMEGVLERLRADAFQPYYNISVSPNDGGIALGQAYIAMHRTMF